MAEHALDAKGLMCPMPIVKLSKLMRALPTGDVVRIEADDPAFCNDLRAWSHKTGHPIIELREMVRGGVARIERT